MIDLQTAGTADIRSRLKGTTHVLTIEEPFGALVEQLRLKAKIRHRQDMPAAMEELLPNVNPISEKTIENIEKNKTGRASVETVKLLCRFFFRVGVLKSPDDVEYFCFRAMYRVRNPEYTGGDVLFSLEPIKVGTFRDVTQLVMSYIGSGAGPVAKPQALAEGIHALSEMLTHLAPPPPGPVERLMQRVQRLVTGAPTPQEIDRVVNDLRHAYDDVSSLHDKFRLASMHAQVDEYASRYVDALTWATHAFGLAMVISIPGVPILKQVQAKLCEEIAEAELNIGARENWDRASELFEKAITLREEMRRELGIEVKVSEQRDLESLFQIARYYSHVGHHDEAQDGLREADRRYKALLGRRQARDNHWFRAQVCKELADNCRFRADEPGMKRNFRRALVEYQASKRRSYADDPREETEFYLNVGYCYRRLGNERRAWKEIKRALDIAHGQHDRRRVAYAGLQLARSPESFERDDPRAFYALLAHHVMRQSGAEADRRQAEMRVHELCEEMTRDEHDELAASLRASEFAVYIES